MSHGCCAAARGCRVASVRDGWARVLIDPGLPAVACRYDHLELAPGDRCVVETQYGQFIGSVTAFSSPVLQEPKHARARILRLAADDDERRADELASLAEDVDQFLRQRVDELGLELKPMRIQLSLTGRKSVVFFSSDQRVDFRALLRDLGQRFHRRFEMRPLGVRDAARTVGAIGPCGRCLCCTTFMDRFHSVTVRMAKRQNLSLNPVKISGMCGRLMCCLAHEVEQYPAGRRRSDR